MSECAKSAVFRGDHEDLLDHLVFACHEHKTNKPMEGYGRELVPFFAPGELLSPLPNRPYASCGSPPRSLPRPAVSIKTSKARKGSPSASRAGQKHVAASGSNLYLLDVKSCVNSTQMSTGPNSAGSLSPIFVSSTSKGCGSSGASLCSLASSPHAACPAFFSSPKPDSLPMPTMGFLTKAASVKRTAPGQCAIMSPPTTVCTDFCVPS